MVRKTPFIHLIVIMCVTGLLLGYVLLRPVKVNNPPQAELTTESEQKPVQTPRFTQVLAFGDSGNGSEAQKAIATLLSQENFDAVLHTGDLVYPDGTEQQIKDYFDAMYAKEIQDVFYPSPGNHDYNTDDLAPYLSRFSLPKQAKNTADNERYYSFDIGKLHLISLDSNRLLDEISTERSDDMADWLYDDLVTVPAGNYVIVYFHHPPFPANTNHPADERVREKLVPLFDQFRVPLVINGHNHNYSRTCKINLTKNGEACAEDGTIYITTGGGGYDLYPFKEPTPRYIENQASVYHYLKITLNESSGELIVQAIDQNQLVIDSLVL